MFLYTKDVDFGLKYEHLVWDHSEGTVWYDQSEFGFDPPRTWLQFIVLPLKTGVRHSTI